jgi:UDP-2,3-diacylglucosamine pyrophosphatase LpxH
LKKHHWHILSQIRKISDKIEVVWVAGNHDGQADIISHLLGIEVVDEYIFESGFKKILVLHGHIFDNFIDEHPILTWFCDAVYRFLQKIDTSHYIARLAKHSSKQYLRCAENIRIKALEYASDKGCDVVCCGHSHHAQLDKSTKLCYANSGCWTEKPCTYLEIFDGEIELKEYTHI